MHRAYTPKTACTGTWIHVLWRTATCPEPIHRKRPAQTRGSTSWGLQPREQGLHTENGLYRHVVPRPVVCSHVDRAYTPKTAGTGTWIQVRGPTATCTGPTHRKRPALARGSTSGGTQPGAQGPHTENGMHRYVNPRPGAYSHLNRAHTPKTAVRGTCIHVLGRTVTCTGPTH